MARRKKKPIETEQRSTFRNPDAFLLDSLGSVRSASGQRVNENTAFNLSAFFGGCRIISEDIAGLDLYIYDESNDKKKRINNHPLLDVLTVEPNPNMSALTWRETMIVLAIVYGNSYSEIVRDGSGRPQELHILDSQRVVQALDNAGNLIYKIYESGKTFQQSQIFHLKGIGFDGYGGTSLISMARESLGLAIAAQNHSSTYFSNGCVVSGILSYPQKLTKEALDSLKEQFRSKHQGSEKAHDILITENGAKFEPTSADAAKSQMLEQQRYGISEIARWLRISPHMIGDLSASTNNNIEQQALEHVKYTLRGWALRLESEIKRKLFLQSEKTLFAEFDFHSLLRGDAASRTTFYTAMVNIGALTPNEVRSMENLPPIEGGDETFIQSNLQPLDKVLNPPAPPPVPMLQNDPKTAISEPVDDPKDDPASKVKKAHRDLLETATNRLLALEKDKVERANAKGEKPGFYSTHRNYVRGAFEPVVDSLNTCLGGSLNKESILNEMVQTHMEASITTNDFSEKRSRDFASQTIEKIGA